LNHCANAGDAALINTAARISRKAFIAISPAFGSSIVPIALKRRLALTRADWKGFFPKTCHEAPRRTDE